MIKLLFDMTPPVTVTTLSGTVQCVQTSSGPEHAGLRWSRWSRISPPNTSNSMCLRDEGTPFNTCMLSSLTPPGLLLSS